MIRTLLMALQVAIQGHSATPLPGFTAVPRCPRSAAADEVVVCGSPDQDHYRLKPLPSRFARPAALPMAQATIGDAKVAATTQQVMIGGVPSNRVMVSVKIPF